MPIPQAQLFQGAIARGMSLPQRFVIEGLGSCLVKFAQNPQGKRVLVNELIGFAIADLLEIEHPPCGAVRVDSITFPSEDGHLLVQDLDGVEIPFLGGTHFYSQWLENSDQVLLEDLQYANIANLSMLAGIVLLDLLLNHWDREPRNLNLILHREKARNRLKLIDLGLAFGSAAWFLEDLQNTDLPPLEQPLPYATIPTAFVRCIDATRDFNLYLGYLERVNQVAIEAILAQIPDPWLVTDLEKDSLLNFLLVRVAALPDYLEQRLTRKEWWQ
jgi:hypothetical protein